MKPSVAVLAALGAALALPSVAGAAVPQPYNPRPHSDFSLHDPHVRLARFDVSAHPSGDRIVVAVKMTARSRGRDLRAVLRIGRCTGGRSTSPTCKPNVSRAVRLHPNSTSIVYLDARVPRPAVRTSAIRVSLTPPGQSNPRVPLVDVLLPSSAWTAFPRQVFGLRAARPWEGDELASELSTVTVRAAQIAHDRLRPTLHWTAIAPAGTAFATAVGSCVAAIPTCPGATTTLARADGSADFAHRPNVLRTTAAAEVLSFRATTAEGSLFDLTMPWPR